MDLFITTFESVAVLLGIGLLGFWIIKKQLIPGNILSLLSPLALEIALPSLIFIRIVTDFSPNDFPDWWQLPLWWCFFTAVTAGLTGIFLFLPQKTNRREFAVSLFYQNGIFFPLAILAGMFPQDSSFLIYLFLFTLFYPAFFFSTFPLFFKKRETPRLNWKKILHPVLIATILAIIIRFAGIHSEAIPNVVISILTLLGGMTIPLIMIILGGNIYTDFHKKGQLQLVEMTKFVLIKNFIFPLIFLGLLLFIHPPYPVALLILIQSAVPPITAVPLLTERSGGDRAIVNQFIVASFLVSLISIPLMVSLFGFFFVSP